eukprot:SAG11_NODE_31141_length_294_cov_1.035897_1_plen_29_part_10
MWPQIDQLCTEMKCMFIPTSAVNDQAACK